MNSIRLVSIACILGVASIVVLAACGGNAGPTPGTAEASYVDLGCAKCHGADREGMRSGPPLHNLAERWGEDDLVAYLRDPQSFVQSNPRLKAMDEEYPIAMPAFPNTPEDELRALVVLMLES
jgi:cytochrome c2